MSVYIPFEAHGACETALIALSGQPNRVYHYSKTIGEEESWAIRDYLTDSILRASDSGKTASEIAALVVHAERCAYRSVAHLTAWKRDCKEASERKFGLKHADTATANNGSLGTWRRMSQRGS